MKAMDRIEITINLEIWKFECGLTLVSHKRQHMQATIDAMTKNQTDRTADLPQKLDHEQEDGSTRQYNRRRFLGRCRSHVSGIPNDNQRRYGKVWISKASQACTTLITSTCRSTYTTIKFFRKNILSTLLSRRKYAQVEMDWTGVPSANYTPLPQGCPT